MKEIASLLISSLEWSNKNVGVHESVRACESCYQQGLIEALALIKGKTPREIKKKYESKIEVRTKAKVVRKKRVIKRNV